MKDDEILKEAEKVIKDAHNEVKKNFFSKVFRILGPTLAIGGFIAQMFLIPWAIAAMIIGAIISILSCLLSQSGEPEELTLPLIGTVPIIATGIGRLLAIPLLALLASGASTGMFHLAWFLLGLLGTAVMFVTLFGVVAGTIIIQNHISS